MDPIREYGTILWFSLGVFCLRKARQLRLNYENDTTGRVLFRDPNRTAEAREGASSAERRRNGEERRGNSVMLVVSIFRGVLTMRRKNGGEFFLTVSPSYRGGEIFALFPSRQ